MDWEIQCDNMCKAPRTVPGTKEIINVHCYCYYFFVFLKFIFNWRILYIVVLIYAIHQHESAIDIHMSPPSWASVPPPTLSYPSRLSQGTSLSSPSHTVNSHWLFILHIVVFPCNPIFKKAIVLQNYGSIQFPECPSSIMLCFPRDHKWGFQVKYSVLGARS